MNRPISPWFVTARHPRYPRREDRASGDPSREHRDNRSQVATSSCVECMGLRPKATPYPKGNATGRSRTAQNAVRPGSGRRAGTASVTLRTPGITKGET